MVNWQQTFVEIVPVKDRLFGDTDITYFCNIIVKEKYVAWLDIGVDDGRHSLLMEELKPFCSTYGNLHTLQP
uniref:Uncharacterized protein n=1 Tax=Arundo donax TaxID=35708 RepID=A0A0A9ABX7_ARUDO